MVLAMIVVEGMGKVPAPFLTFDCKIQPNPLFFSHRTYIIKNKARKNTHVHVSYYIYMTCMFCGVNFFSG